MAVSEQQTQAIDPQTLESHEPATGALVGRFPIADQQAVETAVRRAREAAAWWAGLGFAERKRRLRAFKAELARRSGELCELVQRENGKPRADALIEVVSAIDHLDWAARHAERVLRPQRRRSTLNLLNHAAVVSYEPLGVIGVIGPWNYPVLTPLGSISYALAAGNAVIYKPSELTPAIGQWLAETFAGVVPEQSVLQTVHGSGETGAALCRSGVDKVAFTGSTATGRKVMATCAESLTPVLMELGGKDAMIVDDDADLDAAADAAVWGALQNAGQACVSVERCYVTDRVYDAFVDKVIALASDVRAGDDPEAHFGPMTMPEQPEVVRGHLEEALARGARAVLGDAAAVRPPYVEPVVLVDVPEDAAIMREETFGPVLPIVRVRDADEAVARTNDSEYGLSAAVFSRRRGMALAHRLRAGAVSVNAVNTYIGMPTLPFGGVRASGFGRIHGDDGLKELTNAKAITRQRFRPPVPLLSFQRPRGVIDRMEKLVRLVHGRR